MLLKHSHDNEEKQSSSKYMDLAVWAEYISVNLVKQNQGKEWVKKIKLRLGKNFYNNIKRAKRASNACILIKKSYKI